MNRKAFIEECQKYERMMKESDAIDDIIDQRVEEMGDFCLPSTFDSHLPPEEVERTQQQCDALEQHLAGRGFDVELDRATPLKVRALYGQYLALVTEGLSTPGDMRMVFNGCGGWCEECFQGPWCSVRAEVEAEDDEEDDDPFAVAP